MTPSARVNLSPGVQVVGDNTNDSSSSDESDDIEWFAEPQSADTVTDCAIGGQKYGFANQKQGVFSNLQCVVSELLDLPEPDTTPASERNQLKVQREHVDFSEEHYLADLMESEEIGHILQFRAPWEGDDCQWRQMKFSAAELDVLKELHNREYLLDKEVLHQVYLGLVDIIAAYCYNHRTTLGEDTSESAWTINKLSSTLSWLQSFGTAQDVAEAFVRRALCYPLHRHWELALRVLEDARCVLRLGKKQLLRCLLGVRALFVASEPRYILNQLYVEDYCVWVQHASLHRLQSLAEALGKVTLDKSAMDLDLPELESAARMVLEEEGAEPDVGGVANALSGLSLGSQQGACEGQDSDSSSDESSSSDSESSSSTSESSTLDSDDISSSES
ncbi:protein SHQ1 homolog isoform X2 [Bacillus rossius redtenbacheri]